MFAAAVPLVSAGLSALGGILGGNAQNKGAEKAYGIDKRRLMLDQNQQNFVQQLMAAQEGREGGADAWRKLLATDYAMNRAPMPQLSPYSQPQRSLAGLQPGAELLQAELMKRLQGGNPITPTPIDLFPTPGKSGWLGSGLGSR